jgi:hypothetical protein
MIKIQEIQKKLSLDVASIEKFAEEQKNNFLNFVKNPTEIVTKIIQATLLEKNYKDVAKDLNLPPTYIKAIGKIIQNNNEFINNSNSFESFLQSLSEKNINLDSFLETNNEPKEFVISVWLPDEEYQLDVNYTCGLSQYYELKNNLYLDIRENKWFCNLRNQTNIKHYYLEVETIQEKEEMLQFLLLGCKFFPY